MNINQFLNARFTLLDSKKNRLFLVLFIMVYIVLFLNIFLPFDIDKWHPVNKTNRIIALTGFGVFGALSILFSQFVLRKWMKFETFTVKQFLVWVVFELFFLTALLTFIYDGVNNVSSYFHEFWFNLKYTFLIAVIPYSVALLILALFQKQQELHRIKSESKKPVLTNELIKFPDDKGQVKFTIPLRDVLFMESTDNYVEIFYRSHEQLKKELIRNSLKNFDRYFEGTPIVRCHRSYMVNLENLNLVKKTGQKMLLKLNHVPELIPVSKSYQERFSGYF